MPDSRPPAPAHSIRFARKTPVFRVLFQSLLAGLFIASAGAAPAQMLERLRKEANLTPERFTEYFRDFHFKLGDKLQPPEVFLTSKSGDCDDFASLAAELLRERKYTTRLIAVFMPRETHVVCYVEEAHGYLDFNRRQDATTLQPTDGRLEDMADKIASYFRTNWWCVSEITYEASKRRLGRVAFR